MYKVINSLSDFLLKLSKKLRREADEEIMSRVNKLCNSETGFMDAQVALIELERFFLGDDWQWEGCPRNIEVNHLVVYEIEKRYKRHK